MPTTVCVQLVASDRSRNTLSLPRHLHDSLRVAPGDNVVVKAGRRQVRAVIKTLPDVQDQMERVEIATALRRHLVLPRELRIHIRRNGDGSLELGPFFGILARVIRSSRPYGEQNRDFRIHMALGRRKNVAVYAFGPGDIDLRKGVIRARVFDENRKRWIRRPMPIPHVVWNRSYWPGTRNRSQMRQAMRRLYRVGAHPFNPGVGTKWQVYQLLRADSNLRQHVPMTEQYRSPRTVFRFLNRYTGVYMKPLWGGWGIGIMRIRALGRGRYRISRTIGRSGRNWNRVVGRAGLAVAVRRLVDGPYLVQQEIPLARVNGRVADIRVLAQRRAEGEWGITGAVVRVGKPRSVISNLHGGGRAFEIRHALSIMYQNQPELVDSTLEKIHSVALQTVRKVEERFGRFGEIGLDFGLDDTGHVWFIEVNSRPGRHSFRTTSPDDVWLASSANPVEYAKRLATFS